MSCLIFYFILDDPQQSIILFIGEIVKMRILEYNQQKLVYLLPAGTKTYKKIMKVKEKMNKPETRLNRAIYGVAC